MRKINAVITPVILILFILHGVSGVFNLTGFGNSLTRIIAWPMAGLIGVHMVFGIILTAQTLSAQKKAGVSYPKENRLFWARRISGFLIMILIGFHVYAFTGVSADHFRLTEFTPVLLGCQILLVITIAVHVISNVKPMLISLGVPKLKPRAGDIIFWVTILLCAMAAAFIFYYFRWGAV